MAVRHGRQIVDETSPARLPRSAPRRGRKPGQAYDATVEGAGLERRRRHDPGLPFGRRRAGALAATRGGTRERKPGRADRRIWDARGESGESRDLDHPDRLHRRRRPRWRRTDRELEPSRRERHWRQRPSHRHRRQAARAARRTHPARSTCRSARKSRYAITPRWRFSRSGRPQTRKVRRSRFSK